MNCGLYVGDDTQHFCMVRQVVPTYAAYFDNAALLRIAVALEAMAEALKPSPKTTKRRSKAG